MSLNTAHANGGVLIHQGEVILLHAQNTQLTFSGSDELKFGEKTGNSYLTSHRLIFLVSGKNAVGGGFQSFSFPFVTLTEVNCEQPVFGANFLKGKVRAQPNGNWKGEAKFKIIFKNGGAIDFSMGMLKAIQLVQQMGNRPADWNTPPPAYNDVAGPNAFNAAPPSYYNTMPANYYGWSPQGSHNFHPPEQGSVFISEQPPPYPGIGHDYAMYNVGPNGAYPAYQQNNGYPQQQQGGFQQQQQPLFGPIPLIGPTGHGFNPPPYNSYAGDYTQQQQPAMNPGYGQNQPAMNPYGQNQPAMNPGYPGQNQPALNPSYPGQNQPAMNPGYGQPGMNQYPPNQNGSGYPMQNGPGYPMQNGPGYPMQNGTAPGGGYPSQNQASGSSAPPPYPVDSNTKKIN